MGEPVVRSQQEMLERTGGFWTEVGVENAAAHSGNEPHDLYFNDGGGESFSDLRGLSGFRDRGDGRVLVTWDPDGDGLLDLAAVHANAPRLRMWENRLSERAAFVTVRAEGGARPGDHEGWTNRSAVGAVLRGKVGGRTVVRALSMGQGMASQSSAEIHLGLGDANDVTEATVTWPSGRSTDLGTVRAGTLVRVSERDSVSVSFQVARPRAALQRSAGLSPPKVDFPADRPTLFTTFATWCTACRDELPGLGALKAAEAGLTLLAIPIDKDDATQAITNWIDAESPPWTLQMVAPADRESIRAWSVEALGYEAVPTTFTVGSDGAVHGVWAGAPTLSELRRATGPR